MVKFELCFDFFGVKSDYFARLDFYKIKLEIFGEKSSFFGTKMVIFQVMKFQGIKVMAILIA